MSNIFWTADTHFQHKALINKGLRIIPFEDPTIEKHDNMIIQRWNDVVGKNDTVYHLGDFAWCNLAAYRKELKGRIHLIKGNHDRLKSADYDLFESVSDFKRVKVGDQKIYMMHYSLRTWPDQHYGSWCVMIYWDVMLFLFIHLLFHLLVGDRRKRPAIHSYVK